MNILLLGSGGREHAFAWKMSQSPHCSALFIAPGNAGTRQFGTNLSVNPTDFDAVKKACLEHVIGMVVVGPEEPLVKGIVDFLGSDPELAGLQVIGPNSKAAQLEGSKAFSKDFMIRHNIPTAAYRQFSAENFAEGTEYLKNHSLPIVLKADGLAAGKGVVICHSHIEAMAEFELMLQQDKFGEAGRKVVVEEFLEGIEVSVFVLSDGQNWLLLPEAKDYKQIWEGNKGSNTGGMGAVSPVPFASEGFMSKVTSRIIEPTMQGLKEDGIDYNGFIFIGVIKVGDEPMVIEYNCRMGDPETEVVLPRIGNDLVGLFLAMGKRELNQMTIDADDYHTCTIVAVSRGYPGSFEKGFPIYGLDDVLLGDSHIFHSGTKVSGEEVVTSGGRVLCVTSRAESLAIAISRSRAILQVISFDGMYFRRDIGFEFL